MKKLLRTMFIILLGGIGFLVYLKITNPIFVTPDLAIIFSGDIIGSGDTVINTGPVTYQIKEMKCNDTQECIDETTTHTGYFKTYTSDDLGIRFSILITDAITGDVIYPTITRKNNEIFRSDYGDIPIITVYTKDVGTTTANEIQTKYFQNTETGCTVGDYDIFGRAGFDTTNKKTDYEYIGITFSGEWTDELKSKYHCLSGGDICHANCTTGAGLASDDGAMVFYLGKKDSPTYLLVQGGQEYAIGGNFKNFMETIEIIK